VSDSSDARTPDPYGIGLPKFIGERFIGSAGLREASDRRKRSIASLKPQALSLSFSGMQHPSCMDRNFSMALAHFLQVSETLQSKRF
jgi:hypothetical protein